MKIRQDFHLTIIDASCMCSVRMEMDPQETPLLVGLGGATPDFELASPTTFFGGLSLSILSVALVSYCSAAQLLCAASPLSHLASLCAFFFLLCTI
jgi:hypothetical protein